MSRYVLVVDDSAAIQKSVRLALDSYPIQLLVASTVNDAIHSQRHHKVSVILVDAGMPGLNKEILEGKLSQNSSVPCVLLVGSHEPTNLTDLEGLSHCRVLRKPFKAATLIQLLEQYLGAGLQAGYSLADRPNNSEKSIRSGALAHIDQGELHDQMPEWVRQAVEKYCQEHFLDIAQQVVERQIQQLMQQKLRHLIDN